MEIQKITYDTKKYIRNDPNYPKTQTVTDEDMNEIKSVVNNNAYKQDEDYLKLKNALINVETEESKSIHIEDASELPAKLEILGNQEQETREGYNLLNNILESQTINGLTVVVNKDKSVSINGTATANTNIIFDKRLINTLAAGTYTLKDCQTYIDSEENNGWWKADTAAVTKTFTETPQLSTHGFYLYFSSGTTVNKTYYPALVKGTEEKPYEQYGASPSPEYPSPVICLGSNKNKFNKDTVSLEKFIIASNGVLGNLETTSASDYIEVKSSSFIILSGETNNYPNGGAFYDNNKNYISGILTENIKNAYKVPEGAKYIRITTTTSLNNNIKLEEVEKGTEATSYSPHGQGATKISKINKNIYDITKYPFTNHIAYNSSGEQVFWTGYCGILDYFPVKGNTQYTFSNNLNKPIYCGLVFYNKDKQVISAISTNTTTFTTPENCKYIRFAIQSDTLPTWVQIEVGNTATSNVEHQQEDYLLYIQREMLKGDYFVKESDGWKEVHNWDKIIFTGNENWSKSSATIIDRFLLNVSDLTPINNVNKLDIYSNYFKPGVYNNSELGYIWHNGKNLAVNYSDYSTTTLEEFKAKLQELYNAGNPLYAFYKTETSTKLSCTEEQSAVLEELSNLDLFEGVNNIITAEDIALLKLNYIADTKTYVDNKYNQLANQILEIAGGN